MRCVEIRPGPAQLDVVVDRLWSAGVDGVEERNDDGPVLVASMVGATPEQWAALVGGLVQLVGRDRVVEREVDPAQWRDAWRPWARPVDVEGRIRVRPAWSPPEGLPAGMVELVVEPGDAWGHGRHPSTVLALTHLCRRPPVGRRLLDLGCGSGVLSVGAALLGAAEVVAVDIDPAALRATAANAVANGVAGAVRVSAGDRPPEGSFDVVVANIGAATLVALAGEVRAATGPGGEVVLSGLLDERVDEVVEVYRHAGLVESERRSLEGWSSPLLVRTA